MRKFAQVVVLAWWVAGNCAAQTTAKVPETPASSAGGGGKATDAVIANIIEVMSVYPPAWTHYFPGQSRPSERDGALTATVRDDGRIGISGVIDPMPVPVGRSWTNLDKRNKCGRGYVYSAWPVFTAEEAFTGVRPRDWGWENVFHKGKCVGF